MRVEERLNEIEDALNELETLIMNDMSSFLRSRTARYAARYSIIQIVEAAADLALQILEKEYEEEARGYREAFKKLSMHGVISPDTADEMCRMVSLRNMIVHRYWDVDDARVYREAKSGILHVRKFVREVKSHLSEKA